jgi:hypothetical protein
MRNSYIALQITSYKSKNRPIEIQGFSQSDVLSYEDIVEFIPSYTPTDRIKLDIKSDYNAFLAIREDHPLFNICLIFNRVLEDRATNLAMRELIVPVIRDILTKLVNSKHQQQHQ